MNVGVSVVIPCCNEERTIGAAVEHAFGVLKNVNLPSEVIVVANDCDDRSAEIAEEHGARVVTWSKRGYGHALRKGIEKSSYEYVITVDADLSYPLDQVPTFLERLKDGADLVLGNRLRGAIQPRSMPLLNRYLGTPVLSWLLRTLHGVPTFDCNSGMRGMRRSKILELQLRSTGMEFASEMLIQASERGLTYEEVAIPFHRDSRGGRSHLRPWRDGLRHLRVIVGV